MFDSDRGASASSRYEYLDRTARQIRLLILQPAVDQDQPISCSLQIVSLFADLNFEAVSYSWGDPAVTESIVLDGATIHVAVSIWSALKSFRHASDPRTLWIDVVCINQSDLEERESQLQLMGSIYRKSRIVRVWLGPSATEDEDAISILKSLAANENVKDILGYSKIATARTKQLQHFFGRPWWQRLWVIQEVGCGRNVTFQIAHQILDYKDMHQAYLAANSYFTTIMRGYQYGSFGNGFNTLMSIFESVALLERIRKLCRTEGLYSTDAVNVRRMTMVWIAIANLLRNRKATIASDRLYALYGLLPIVAVAEPGMEPSYSLTTAEAFTRTTYALIESSKSLMMLNYLARRDEQSQSLPSWVPDWRLASSNTHELIRRVEREQVFKAALDTDFYVRRLSGSAICLRGFFVDLVEQWQPTPIEPTASPILHQDYIAWREMWANTDPDNAMLQPYLDGSTAETAFRRTMIWDCELGDVNDDEGEDTGGILRQLTQAEGIAMWSAHDLATEIAFGDNHDVMGETLSEKDAARTNYMINCARRRGFFVTLSGCIGMSESNLEAGDYIFIVAGNSHPVVLRPSQTHADTWHAVAECYLHGFMYGSGIKNIEICKKFEDYVGQMPELQKLKGTDRNPKWDEIKNEPEPFWKWLIVE